MPVVPKGKWCFKPHPKELAVALIERICRNKGWDSLSLYPLWIDMLRISSIASSGIFEMGKKAFTKDLRVGHLSPVFQFT